jgi:signal transduction histidine kinase
MSQFRKLLLIILALISINLKGQQNNKSQILAKIDFYKNAVSSPLSDSLLKYYFEIVNIYKGNKTDSALFFANKALVLAKNIKQKKQEMECLNMKGDIYLFSGWGRSSWWLAFENYTQASKMAWQLKDRLAFAKNTNTLAICYISKDKSGDYTEKNLYYGTLSEDALINPNFAFPNTFQPDSSDSKATRQTIKKFIETIGKGAKYFEKIGHKKEVMYRLHRMANLQLQLIEDIDEAEKNIQKAITIADEIKDYEFEVVMCLTTAHNFYHHYHNLEKQKIYAQKGYDLAEKHHFVVKKALLSDQLYHYYKDTQQYQKALTYKEYNIAVIDSLNLIGDKEKAILFKEKSETQLREFNTLQELESQKRTQTTLITGIMFLLLLLSAGLWYSNVLRKKNRELQVKNKEISEAMLKGQTTERKRVASDLHDNLGSTMSSIRWAFQAIDKTKWSDHEKEIFTNVQTMFDKAYDDIRLLSHNLLPEEFERFGLTTTLQSFIKKINKNTTIRFDLKVDESFGRVDKKIEFELYSICLELVNNIMKHSKATKAMIELSRTQNQIKLIVADNGIGIFNNDSDGKGMKNVQARVESLGGTWKIQNAKDEGFVNEVLVPV